MPYKCPMCGLTLPNLISLVTHVRSKHVYGDACPCCGARTLSLATHALHNLDACHAALYIALRGKGNRRCRDAKRRVRMVIEEALRV